jgi:hypothetical protein
MDTKKWEEVVSAKYKTNKWSHLIGCIPNSGGIQLFGFECRSLIVHQAHGTQLGTKFSSRLEFAKFFAVLYATVTVEEDMRLLWAREDPYRWCIQFPSLSSSGLGTTQSEPPAFRKDDTPLNRKPGGLMEQSNASLQRGDQG